jgi:uncharacterized protein (TIGR00297 family)
MLYAAAIAVLAALCRWLTPAGAACAFVVGSLIFEAGGLPLGLALVLFFFGAVLVGRLGWRKKQRVGLAEGKRNAGQVLANGGVAALCCVAFLLTQHDPWLLAAYAAICAASADTWATEIGTSFGRKFFHVTSLEPSEPGPDGVVSLEGLLGAFLGSAVPGTMLVFAGHAQAVGPIVSIGFLGSLLDSVLGDTIEGRWRWFGNDAVNFVATLVAALAAFLYAHF